jgi:cellulose synthase/poly-beta-1,6-N-acetylglucosamine synthase-like glycosyltransferase
MGCKGVEPGLERNIEAVLNQKYDLFRTIIVADSTEDPAYSIADSVLRRHTRVKAQLCTLTDHRNASGKVAALLTAIEIDALSSDVYAFVDSDALVPADWLAALVNPLHEESVGATTGFRWYFARGGFWSHVEAAWNASGTNLLFNERYNFPWGGAMAIRAETLRRIDIENVWGNAISDDLSLNFALRKHGYGIMFLPQCCVVTYSETNLQRLLSWATRQVTLVKAYNRRLWNYGFMAYAFFNLLTILGAFSLVAAVLASPTWLLPAFILFLPSLLGACRNDQRNRSFRRAMPEFASEFERGRRLDSVGSLIVPWIMTYCILKSARTNAIEWRSRRYELTK